MKKLKQVNIKNFNYKVHSKDSKENLWDITACIINHSIINITKIWTNCNKKSK